MCIRNIHHLNYRHTYTHATNIRKNVETQWNLRNPAGGMTKKEWSSRFIFRKDARFFSTRHVFVAFCVVVFTSLYPAQRTVMRWKMALIK